MLCVLNQDPDVSAFDNISLLDVALMTGNDRAACKLVALFFDEDFDCVPCLRPKDITEHHCIFRCDSRACDGACPVKIFAAPEERIAAITIAVRHSLRLQFAHCWELYGLALNRFKKSKTRVVAHILAFLVGAPSIARLIENEGGWDVVAFTRTGATLGDEDTDTRMYEQARAAYERARDYFLFAYGRASDQFLLAESEYERVRQMYAREAPPRPR